MPHVVAQQLVHLARGHRSGRTVVHPGLVLDADDPLVKELGPGVFISIDQMAAAGRDGVIETATAAPGEKRAVKKRTKKPPTAAEPVDK